MTKFCVLFQGLVSLVEFQDGYIAYVLGMTEHRNAAGEWLCETELPKGGQFELVVPGSAGKESLDAATTLIVEAKLTAEAIKRFVYCQIKLPKPDKITPFWTGTADKENFKNFGGFVGAKGETSVSFSALLLFEYSSGAPENAALKLQGEVDPYWTPRFTDGDDSIGVLNVFATPEVSPKNPNHQVEEFNRSAKFLGSDIETTKKPHSMAYNIPSRVAPYPPPTQMRLEEFGPVEMRGQWVPLMINSVRTGQVPEDPLLDAGHIPPGTLCCNAMCGYSSNSSNNPLGK